MKTESRKLGSVTFISTSFQGTGQGTLRNYFLTWVMLKHLCCDTDCWIVITLLFLLGSPLFGNYGTCTDNLLEDNLSMHCLHLSQMWISLDWHSWKLPGWNIWPEWETWVGYNNIFHSVGGVSWHKSCDCVRMLCKGTYLKNTHSVLCNTSFWVCLYLSYLIVMWELSHLM